MTVRYYYVIHKQPTFPIPFAGEVCTTSRTAANTPALTSALKQCPYHDSGGARCEAESGHEGRHDFTDASFAFMQRRYRKVQGPVCHTRRYPEYIYEDDREECW